MVAHPLSVIVSALALWVCVARPVAAAPADDAEVPTPVDTILVWPKKQSGHDTWEKVVAFPGQVAFLPVRLVLEGMERVILLSRERGPAAAIRDVLMSDDGRRGLLPVYIPLRGGGAKFFQKGLVGYDSKFTTSLTRGLRSRWEYGFDLERIRFRNGRAFSGASFHYQFYPDENFFGIGANTSERDLTNFALKRITGELLFGADLGGRVALSSLMGVHSNDVLGGRNRKQPSLTDRYTPETLVGLDEGATLLWFGVRVQHDSRNRPGNPAAGGQASLGISMYRQVHDDRYGFWRVSTDLRRYLHLAYGRVLMFRVGAEFTEPVNGREIPFYYLSEVGNKETIRGFRRGRFRDRHMLFGTMEYRYPVWRMMDWTLFIDAGRVSRNVFDEYDPGAVETGYGTGFRLWSPNGLVARFEIGKTRDGVRFYFVLNEE